MIRTILSGPIVLSAHASPLLHSRHFRVLHEGENEFIVRDPSKLTEAEFRGTVLKGVKDQQDKLSTLVTEHKTLKDAAEAMDKVLKDGTKTIGEQAAKIIVLEKSLLAARSNREPGEDAKSYLRRAFPDECKALGEAVKAKSNEYVVQKAESTTTLAPAQAQAFDATIYSLVSQYGAFRNLDAHPMSAQTENMIVEVSEPDFVFVAENGEIPETGLGLAPVGATAKKIGGILRVSNEALQDTIFDLGAYVAEKFARAGARRTDYVAYRGTGAADAANGGFTGIVNAGTATAAAAGHIATEQMTTYDEVAAFMFSLGQEVLENPDSAWMMNPVALARLLGIKDGNGRPIFLSALAAPAYGAIGTLLGRPVHPVAVMPALPGAG